MTVFLGLLFDNHIRLNNTHIVFSLILFLLQVCSTNLLQIRLYDMICLFLIFVFPDRLFFARAIKHLLDIFQQLLSARSISNRTI
jgi:hypothetical protein